MTLTAWAVDELASDAQVIRESMGSLIGAAGGTVGVGGLEVTQKGTPNMSVIIKGGTPAEGGLWIPGFSSTTGPYYFRNSSNFEQPIEASGATFARIDTIVARMYDNPVDKLGKHEPVFEALKGKEEAGVELGNLKGIATVPANCYVLAYVLVPAKAASIVTADIKNMACPFYVSSRMTGLVAVQHGENFTAEAGELAILNTPGITSTLPTKGIQAGPGFIGPAATIGFVCAGVGPVKITCAAGPKIFGDGIAGVSTIVLGESQHVVLQADGQGNWFIVAGDPKREWVELTLEAGFEASKEEATGENTPAARREPGGVVRLRGQIKNNSGEEKGGGHTIGIIPNALLRPSRVIFFACTRVASTSLTFIDISPTGDINLYSGLPNLNTLILDGLTFTTG